MNIEEYISSGIVESYVLGLADAQERAEFEKMCVLHPEVKAARDNFERSLEAQGRSTQLQPPLSLKKRIFSAIELETTDSNTSLSDNIPPRFAGVETSSPGNDGYSKARVARMPVNLQKIIAVAAVVLLILSTALNFYFFSQYRHYNEQYRALLVSQTELAQHNEVLQTRVLEYEKTVDMMKDPGMAIVKMPAIPNSPDPTSATVVYWDTATKDVYLAVSKLPAPAADQQYQLWAMVDGNPVDAGVFDLGSNAGLFKMKNIPRAQAFAITLERKGGSATPSLDKLYVMGKV